MRTLTLHTADELVERWRRRAIEAEASADKGDEFDGHYAGLAQGYRVAAAELLAILAASMELEAAHHGDPEPEYGTCGYHGTCGGVWEYCDRGNDPNALREWLAGERP